MTNKAEGYLVVLVESEYVLPTNPRYRGLYRLPPYPSRVPEEEQAVEDYVFGSYKNKEGLIPESALARELLTRLSKSPRRFEIIYARAYAGGRELLQAEPLHFLGYDVGCPSPFWSIVGDFPIELSSHSARLNEYGLFKEVGDAEAYLRAYHEGSFADDSPRLRIWEVYLDRTRRASPD